jgi:hypothetical protein
VGAKRKIGIGSTRLWLSRPILARLADDSSSIGIHLAWQLGVITDSAGGHQRHVPDLANFAKIFCNDLDLTLVPWADTVANQIRGVASMEIVLDGASDLDAVPPNGEEMQECRVILSVSTTSTLYFAYSSIEIT